jgi:hypothetical protein
MAACHLSSELSIATLLIVGRPANVSTTSKRISSACATPTFTPRVSALPLEWLRLAVKLPVDPRGKSLDHEEQKVFDGFEQAYFLSM